MLVNRKAERVRERECVSKKDCWGITSPEGRETRTALDYFKIECAAGILLLLDDAAAAVAAAKVG